MFHPKISIVTPSFNQGQFLEETINSVLNQNYSNLEYIIIDGGSTDDSLEIIKKYSRYLTYWESKIDNGQSEAINKGILKSTGKIFNWINSDDVLEPNALLNVADMFNKKPFTQLLCGYSNIFDENNTFQNHLHRSKIYNTTEETIYKETINQQGMFYDLNSIKELGGVNETLHFVMDLELWFRFLCRYGISYVEMCNSTLASFRYHENSKTVSSIESFTREKKQIFYHLFNHLNLSEPIIHHHALKPDTYKSKLWEIRNLKRDRFMNLLFKDYMFDYYKNAQYDIAKQAFCSNIFKKDYLFKRSMVSLLKNLYFTK